MGLTKNKVMNWSSYRARISLSLEETNKNGQAEWNKKDLVKNNWPRKLLFISGTYGSTNKVVATKLLFSCAQITHYKAQTESAPNELYKKLCILVIHKVPHIAPLACLSFIFWLILL